MRDRAALLVAQTGRGNPVRPVRFAVRAPGRPASRSISDYIGDHVGGCIGRSATAKGRIVPRKRLLDLPATDTVAARPMQLRRACSHPDFDPDHLRRRIARRLLPARLGPLRLQFHQVRRAHHRIERRGEGLHVLHIAKQHPPDIAPGKYAALVRDDAQDLFRALQDDPLIVPGILCGKPPTGCDQPAPRHLRGMNTHMPRRRDLQPAILVRTVIDTHIQPGPRQVLVGDFLPQNPQVP